MTVTASAAPLHETEIIDAWVNHLTPDAARNWLDRPDMASIRKQFHRTLDAAGQSTEELLDSMDRFGIARGLLTSVPMIFSYGSFERECETLREVVDAHPERLRALPFLDPTEPLRAARDLRHAIEDHGFAGARIFPAAAGIAPNDRRFYPVYTVAAELGVPITVNVGIPGPSYPADPARPLHLDDVCRDFPDLTIVATHMGHPWESELVGLMVKYPQLHLMTSAWAPRYYPRAVLDFLGSRGSRQVMFASDHPLVPFERCIADLEMLDLPDNVWPAFLSDNAKRVFWSE